MSTTAIMATVKEEVEMVRRVYDKVEELSEFACVNTEDKALRREFAAKRSGILDILAMFCLGLTWEDIGAMRRFESPHGLCGKYVEDGDTLIVRECKIDFKLGDIDMEAFAPFIDLCQRRYKHIIIKEIATTAGMTFDAEDTWLVEFMAVFGFEWQAKCWQWNAE